MGKYNPTLDQLMKLESFHLFDFDYQIGGDWRDELEEYLVERFWDCEIAPELTVDTFKRKWKAKLRDIGPYYVALKRTVLEDYDPSFTIASRETHTKTRTGNANTQRDNTGTRTDQAGGTDTTTETDYPATGDLVTDIPSARQSIQHGLINTRSDNLVERLQGTDFQEETFTKTRTGSANKNAIELMMEYRNSLLRINGMIAGELSHLFLLHY